MNRKRWIIAAAVLVGLAVLGVGAYVAYEEYDDRRDRERELLAHEALLRDTREGKLVPLARILDLTAQHVPGEVVKVELEDEHGRRIYEIKVLAENGRVRELKYDAHDAELLEIEND